MPKVFELAKDEAESRRAISTLFAYQEKEMQCYCAGGKQGDGLVVCCSTIRGV